MATSKKTGGRDRPDSDFDAEQIKMGIQVEREHTDDLNEAKAIAKDHLAEISDYYTRLKGMERQADKEGTAEKEETKKTVTQMLPDGGQRILPGKEPLMKDPKQRWSMLKAELNNELSIKRLVSDEDLDPEMQADEQQEAAGAPLMQPEEQGGVDQGAQADWLRQEGYSEDQIRHILHGDEVASSEGEQAPEPEQPMEPVEAPTPTPQDLKGQPNIPSIDELAARELQAERPNLDRLKAAMMVEEHKHKMETLRAKAQKTSEPASGAL